MQFNGCATNSGGEYGYFNLKDNKKQRRSAVFYFIIKGKLR